MARRTTSRRTSPYNHFFVGSLGGAVSARIKRSLECTKKMLSFRMSSYGNDGQTPGQSKAMRAAFALTAPGTDQTVLLKPALDDVQKAPNAAVENCINVSWQILLWGLDKKRERGGGLKGG